MPVGQGPSWDTPAKLDGLPAKNWKTREGVTLRASFAGCVQRWLELHPSDRISVSLSWGPNCEGHHGYWERANIVGYLERNGPPPEMGPHVTIQHVRNWLAHDRNPAPTPHIDANDLPPGPSVGGDNGAAVWKAWADGKNAKTPQT